jgi:FdhE protein
MTSIDAEVKDLQRRHPEWQPWLAVVQETIREIEDPRWDAYVPNRADGQQSKIPLLAQATLVFDPRWVERTLDELLNIAYRLGTPKMASLKSVVNANLDALALFNASLCQDTDTPKRIAAGVGADPDAFEAVVALIALPFLHACNRRWSSFIAANWSEGYCPSCGAWPAFAEVRGIERSRYFRCGRCGGEWQSHCLSCPYCALTDHKELVSLVPEKDSASQTVEACNRCLGYVKTFATLQRSPAARVMLDDLATVALDLAAMEQGYKRPHGAGFVLSVNLIENRLSESALAQA